MREARVAAQAKVNLRLRILEREPSGFHQLETLFLRIALADQVTVRAGGSTRSLDCAGPAMPFEGLGATEQNLAWRAACAYADATGWPSGFDIEVVKQIPVGGGLGGGSADAAAVLRALDALAPAPLGPRLVELAATLGSDVPFLASALAFAIGRGRGERLQMLAPPPVAPMRLVIPPFAVNTAEAYRELAQSRASGATRIHQDPPLDPRSLSTWPAIAAVAANDFEPLVAAREPSISRALDALRTAGASFAMMSGSGSTLFGVFPGKAPDAPSLPAGYRLIDTESVTDVAPAVSS